MIAYIPKNCIVGTYIAMKVVGMEDAGATDRDSQETRDLITIDRLAKLLRAELALRKNFFSSVIFGAYSWDILLELLTATGERQNASVTAMATLSDIPATTGLRWINVLSNEGLVTVANDLDDPRGKSLALTDQGRKNMESYLGTVAELRNLRLVG